ncbi:glycosyltransferase family 4 protein [Streptomyces chiangmaiensis]|uniref:Glycosyltransferase family 4 protein n=1 Tax=Streptomyces chiangmaiensis TaxID=766497 RepID=A0ABU7FXC6_9ACTN|nr:glycosyltransferase family 4 protein [Streptomyces chiangmaiensis]MED7827724.1 glycosyltransferase family 4 protein [Streptomyces chiangmaiensis]
MSRRPVRALTLAVSVAWAELRHDPLRPALLAVRLLPTPVRRALRRLEIRLTARARPSGPSDEPSPARVPAPPGRPILPVPGRVLHLVTHGLPYRQAGHTLRTQALTRAQSAAGLDPHVVTRIGFPAAQGVFDARPLQLLGGVPQHRLLPRWLPYGSGAVLARNAELAARLVERLRPSVLHAAGDHGNGRVALALRETYGLPVVYEVRGFPEESWSAQAHGRSRSDGTYRVRREWETYCMRESDAVLTLGEAMKAEIVSRGVPEERVRVVPHAVDPLFLEPLPDGGAVRTRLGIGPEEYVVGTVSGFTRHEAIATLLESGAELRRRGVPVRLLLVGDGPERTALEYLAGRLGLRDGTALFTGRVPQEQVRDCHAVLDVFAVPRTDRLVTPLEPAEAMASGLPVVASDVPAMRDLVESGVNGRLIPPESSLVWADTLEMLFSSQKTRRTWGAAAQALVARERTWARVAAATRDTYHALGCL